MCKNIIYFFLCWITIRIINTHKSYFYYSVSKIQSLLTPCPFVFNTGISPRSYYFRLPKIKKSINIIFTQLKKILVIYN
ncbi:hypothetical protein SXCC_01869 [Gluconacetobacter sp. SXCC-1]|nr:hypothetical protein SXCC_01869 [Gluconacetobacter sp. SXCC-1]